MEGDGHAITAVCRFWRERCKEEKLLGNNIDQNYCHLKHPLSLVVSLCIECKAVKCFVRQEELKLRRAVDIMKHHICSDYGPLIRLIFEHATFLELLGEVSNAAAKATEATQLASSSHHTLSVEYLSQLHCYHQRKQLEFQMSLQRQLRLGLTCAHPSPGQPQRQVSHIPFGSLSHSEFIAAYAVPGIPVVFTGADRQMLPSMGGLGATPSSICDWSIQSLLHHIGHLIVTPKTHSRGSVLWAKHEDASPCSIGSILTSCFPEVLEHDDKQMPDITGEKVRPYLVDWSLPVHCGRILPPLCSVNKRREDTDRSPIVEETSTVESFRMPAYFVNDLLQHCPEGTLYRDTWPSLFVGGTDTKSALHVDSFGSNFWMLLVRGRKRWTFFSREDICLLRPTYPFSFEPVFPDDVEDLAAAAGVASFTVVLEPGELLFVPAGAPHSVVNLEPTIALSGNYVDMSNIDFSLKVLRQNALTCERSAELVKNLLHIKEKYNSVEAIAVADRHHTFSWSYYKCYEKHRLSKSSDCSTNLSTSNPLPEHSVVSNCGVKRRFNEDMFA